ncbi:hypothetical protein [uncultured Roseibium sp.]|uniref:hypothetical protein n=1 Tax=uncultured Roseibium sp. TaxID=1936171 RepID=UPI0032178BE1
MTRNKTVRSKSSAPISLRLTSEERSLLEQFAQGQSLSSYIRGRLFCESGSDDATVEQPRVSKQTREQQLAQILGLLGKSDIAASMRDLAEAARIGVLPLTPDVLADIQDGCSHVLEIRDLLLRALGFKPEGNE